MCSRLNQRGKNWTQTHEDEAHQTEPKTQGTKVKTQRRHVAPKKKKPRKIDTREGVVGGQGTAERTHADGEDVGRQLQDSSERGPGESDKVLCPPLRNTSTLNAPPNKQSTSHQKAKPTLKLVKHQSKCRSPRS